MAERFSDEQIEYMLRQYAIGVPVAVICRKLSISKYSFYHLKNKYAGIDGAEFMRLKTLEKENKELKEIIAGLWIKNLELRDMLERNPPPAPDKATPDVDAADSA